MQPPSFRFRRLWLRQSFAAALLLLALFISACQTGVAVPPANHRSATPTATIVPPADLLSAQTLTVGSYADYLPQEYTDPSNQQLTGFDIDLITAIAQRLHLRVQVVNEEFSKLISSLMMKHFDVVISAVSITSDLQQKVNFIPYLRGGESLMVASGNPAHIMGLDSLCGQKVAVKVDTFEQHDLSDASDTCRQSGKAAITLVVSQQYADVARLLIAHTVAATYLDSAQTDYFVKQYPNQCEVAGAVLDANQEGIAVRKEDTALFNALQRAFMALKADGTYQALIKRWGLVSGDLTAPPAPPPPTPTSTTSLP